MKEEEKSKFKLNIILSLIGITISLICLLLEVFVIKGSPFFWIIILLCNTVIFMGNVYEYTKNDKKRNK